MAVPSCKGVARVSILSTKPIRLKFSAGFQFRYCLIITVVLAVSSLLLYRLMDKSLSGSYLENLRTLYYLDQNLSFYLSVLALLQAFFILILTLVIVLLVSHQIAGPVFRYESILKGIQAGSIPKIVATRHSDQLKTTVDSLNALTSRLRSAFQEAKVLQQQLDVDLADPDSLDLSAINRQVAEVRKNVGHWRG